MGIADVTANARVRGFTLIELMVALAIAALLLLIGLPSFTTFLRNSEIRSTSESLLNGLRAATAEAANRNKKVTFELAGATGADWRFWVLDDDGVTQKELQSYSKKEAGASSKITLTPAGQLTVTFNGLGRVDIDPANPNNHIRRIDIDSIVAGEARPLRIIVDDPNPSAAGKRGLRLCDPDPALAALVPPDPRAC
jgi:type IV fimbrial biogenesis protein FimT